MSKTHAVMADMQGPLGCDVSRWQGRPNYGVFDLDYVIYKAGGADGGGCYPDSQFNANAAGFGTVESAYWFYGGIGDPKKEARYFLGLLKGSAWWDMPWTQRFGPVLDWEPIPPARIGDGAYEARTFMEVVNEEVNHPSWCYSAGWTSPKGNPGDLAWLRQQPFWKACYATDHRYYPCAPWANDCVAWQYTSTGHVNGINGNCDMNIMRQDVFDAITRGAHLDVPEIVLNAPTVPVLQLEETMPIIRHFIEPGSNEPKDMYILVPAADRPGGFGWLHLDSPQVVGDGVHAGAIAATPAVVLPNNDQNENALWERYAVLNGPAPRDPVAA